jgi:hypothetical protein
MTSYIHMCLRQVWRVLCYQSIISHWTMKNISIALLWFCVYLPHRWVGVVVLVLGEAQCLEHSCVVRRLIEPWYLTYRKNFGDGCFRLRYSTVFYFREDFERMKEQKDGTEVLMVRSRALIDLRRETTGWLQLLYVHSEDRIPPLQRESSPIRISRVVLSKHIS